jgi:hypothetical protein
MVECRRDHGYIATGAERDPAGVPGAQVATAVSARPGPATAAAACNFP